jgi:long-chain fatty acid transport protein
LFAAAPAFAGGFYLQEQAPAAVGRAFAGEAAIASDASTIYFNPAGMTKLGHMTLTNGAHLLFIDSAERDRGSTRTFSATGAASATGGGNGGDPFDPLVPVPSLFGSMRVGDSPLWLGLGVSAPFGLKVVYDDNWFGRYDSLASDVKTFNVQPSAAYALNDRISIGVGFNAQWMKAKLSNALPNISPAQADGLFKVDGDDIAFGWNAGVLADFGSVRLGAHYRSGIKHQLKGDLAISGLLGPLASGNGVVATKSRVRLPDIATVSIVLGANGPWRLLASGSWYNWSVFQDIRIVPVTGAPRISNQDYRDTWSASIGAEHDLRPGLTLRGGVMRDGGPTRDSLRTTRVAGGDRIMTTAGTSIALSRRLTADFSYAHVFVQDKNVARTERFYAGTAAETVVTTRSRDGTNIDMVAGSITARF